MLQAEKVLQGFGLTKAEVKLYIELLKTGERTASGLAIKSNTNRTFTYDRLRKLEETGLVSSVIKDNKKYFTAAEPSQLMLMLKEKEEQVHSILPVLEKLKHPETVGPKINVFSSSKGIQTALNIILQDRQEVCIQGSIMQFKRTMNTYFEIWNQRRLQEKIFARVLTSETTEIKFGKVELVGEEEKSGTTTFTFGDKVIIIMWSDIPVAIFIQSYEIAREYLQLFNNLWEREIKIYSGIEGIRHAWMELVNQPSKELVGFGFSWELAQIYGREFSNSWHQQRMHHNITTRLIAYDTDQSKKYFDVRMLEWKKFNLKFLNKELCGPACITLSDHLIVQFLYTEKKLRVLVSKNKEMISVYRKHFELLWNRIDE